MLFSGTYTTSTNKSIDRNVIQRGGEVYERCVMLGMQSRGHCVGGSSAGGRLRGVSIYSVSYTSGVTREASIHICAGNVLSLQGSAYGREQSIVCDWVREENSDDNLWEGTRR